MNDKDKEAFEEWYDLPADQTLNDPILYRQFLDDTLPDHTKTFCEKAWQSACEYKDKELMEWKEAARSEAEEVNRLQAENKKLREALEFYSDCWKFCGDEDCVGETKKAREALKEVDEKL